MSDEQIVEGHDQDEEFLTLDDLIPGEEEAVRITVLSKKSENGKAFFLLKPMDSPTLRRYRQIFNGPAGSRRGKPNEALEYVFRQNFIRTERLRVDLNGYQTEADYWLKHPRARLVTEKVMDEYFAECLPEADDTKKSSGGV